MNKDKLWFLHTYIGLICSQLEALIHECQDKKIPSENAIEAQRNLQILKVIVDAKMRSLEIMIPYKEKE